MKRVLLVLLVLALTAGTAFAECTDTELIQLKNFIANNGQSQDFLDAAWLDFEMCSSPTQYQTFWQHYSNHISENVGHLMYQLWLTFPNYYATSILNARTQATIHAFSQLIAG